MTTRQYLMRISAALAKADNATRRWIKPCVGATTKTHGRRRSAT